MKRHALSAGRGSRRRTRGQALVWLLGTMAAAIAVLYGVFNVAQITAGKEKAVNAADAAALAGATVEARMLNLIAYNNRSIIADEVLLVQLISVESWLGYVSRTAENIGTVLDFIPPLIEVAAIIQEAGQLAGEARDLLHEANDGVITVLEAAKTGFAYAHKAVNLLGGAVAEDAATKIVAANRSNFGTHVDAGLSIDNRMAVRGASLALNQERWIAFTKQYTNNDRKDAKQVLLDSRDAFSTNRPGNFLMNFSDPFGFFGLEKNGGTYLKNYDRWDAQDTEELWTKGPKGRDYAPIGWGSASVDKNGNKGSVLPPNRLAQELANDDGQTHSGWSGVPTLFDVDMKGKTSKDLPNLGVDFIVVVRRADTANLTTSHIGMQKTHRASPTGSSEMNERFQTNQLAAMSKARVFFERPKAGLGDWTAPAGLIRPDSAKEYGSLYSPYWEARLHDLTLTEKGALYTAMGINPLLAPATPGGS